VIAGAAPDSAPRFAFDVPFDCWMAESNQRQPHVHEFQTSYLIAFDQDQNRQGGLPHDAPWNQGSHAMPTDAIVVLIMAVAFGIFAGTLYWADVQTRALPK
jgi:hypothetical protein